MYDSFGNPIEEENPIHETENAVPETGPEPDVQAIRMETEVSEPEAEPAVKEDTTYHYSYYSIPGSRETYTTEEPWSSANYQPPVNTGVRSRPARTKVKKEKKHGLTAGRVIALLLCCALIGGLAGVGGAAVMTRRSSQPVTYIGGGGGETVVYQGSREDTVLNVSEVDTSKLMTAAEVYASNVNSTVGITTSITTNYFGYQSTAAASGSGFIITEDGYSITNYHVIENSNSVTVTMYDGTSFDAVVVGYDEKNDLAVLKVNATGLTPVVLGDSDNLNVGDSVVAIGNPLGELTFSLTAGAVSALNREVTLSNTVTMNLIQTDCAINSGNSGGALFNMYGEVIGITNAKYSGSGSTTSASIDNIGFAIPINSVRDLVKQIIEKGYETKPYIGVKVSTVSEDAKNYGIPAGASVQNVTENAPAAKAGLQVNDIITSANGQPISSSTDLVNVVSALKPGSDLELTVYRSGETITLTIKVGETAKSVLPDSSQQQQQQEQQQQQQIPGGSENGSGFGFGFPFGFDFPFGGNSQSEEGQSGSD